MPETDTRPKKDYNLRAHGGKNLPATTKRKEGKGSQTTTSHSSTRGAMLPQGASGGAAIADVSTTSSASETSVLDVSGPPAPGPARYRRNSGCQRPARPARNRRNSGASILHEGCEGHVSQLYNTGKRQT